MTAGVSTAWNDEALGRLRDRVHGEVLVHGDQGYDKARTLWNGMVDRHPAAIVRPTRTPDVVAAIEIARERGLAVTVKGGGHNVAGKALSEGGMVIDLARMRSVRVDPQARRAHVQAGATWHEVDVATQEHGLAVTGGMDSRTGVAGLTLGGGMGYLARAHGLSVDNLVGADVVTASGELVHVDADTHRDLFWALRGGGTVGVVTSFEFRLHPVGPEVLSVLAFHRFEDAEPVLRFYRDVMAQAPDELALYALAVHIPPAEPFPTTLHGEPAIALAGISTLPVRRARSYLDPVAEFGAPILAAAAPTTYAAQQQSFDAGSPDGARYYYKSRFLRGLDDEAIAVLVEHAGELPGPFTMVGIEPMGGAIARVPREATAFPHRDAAFNLGAWAGWTDPDDDESITAWTRRLHEAMGPFGTGGVYVNYLDADEPERVEEAYRDVGQRLAEVRRRWDPDGVFQPAGHAMAGVTPCLSRTRRELNRKPQ